MLCATHAAGLGLGDIDVDTPLGQPFRATIPVRLERDGVSPQDLVVDIPPYREHARLGLPNPIGVDDLQALLVTGPDGAPRVQLTSRRILNEPALSFLVRLTWPEGRLVREYSVLLDPPGLAASAPPEPAPRSVPRPQREAPPPAAAPAPEISVRPLRPVTRPRAAPPPPSSPQPAHAGAEPGQTQRRYGPVQRGESLSRIALENYPEHRAHLASMVRVLFRRNRDAFLHDDPNLLMEGSTLVLPERTEMARAVSRLAAEEPTRLAAAPESAGAAERAEPASPLPQEYGPVRRNETLYRIAEQLAGDRRTGVHEFMQRIYEQNPDAFIDGDMDLLKEGAVLQIPGAADSTALAHAESGETAPPEDEHDTGERLLQEGEDLQQLLGALRAELAREHERQRELQERFARVEERLQALWILLDDAKDYREPAGPTIEHPSDTPGGQAAPPEAEPEDHATTATRPGEVAAREEAPMPLEPAQPSPAAAGATGSPNASLAQIPDAAAPPPATAEARPSPTVRMETPSRPERATQTVARVRERSGSGLGGLLRELPKQAAIVLSLWLLIALVLQWRKRNRLTPEEDLFERRQQQAQQAKERLARLRETHDEGYNRSKPASDRRSKPTDLSETQRWNGRRLAQEAAVYFSYGEHERAMECIEEAIQLEPDWIGNRVLKLRILEGLGRHEEARTLACHVMEHGQYLPEDLRAYVEDISQGKHHAA